jgi:hypothetical protein
MLRFDGSRVLGACFVLLVSACDDPPAKPATAATATTTSLPEPKASAPEAKPTKAQRPEKLETNLTDARREKIEKAHPEAKGFVVMKDLEDKLKTKKLKESKDGIKAFDALAKGKWVLFTGPLAEAKTDGFSLGVSYTPLVEGDRVGLSRQFFLVALSDVKGYDANEMKDGTMVVVLAKYTGSAKGGPGFELVADNAW